MIKKYGDIEAQLIDVRKNGLPDGDKQHFYAFDQYLRFIAGGCTDIIGYPFHGKSLLLKDIVINMAVNSKWRWLVHMPDDGDDVHVLTDLIHTLSGKSFNKKHSNYIKESELRAYLGSLMSCIDFVSADYARTPEELFNLAEQGKYNGLAIDSWNRLNHSGDIKDPSYVGRVLSERNRVMMRSGCHCLMTMHPKAPNLSDLRDGKVTAPSVYNAYGGSEVNNNGKNIIIIFKDNRKDYDAPYYININKVKPKQCGEIAEFEIYYDGILKRFYYKSASGQREYAAVDKPSDPLDYIQGTSQEIPF